MNILSPRNASRKKTNKVTIVHNEHLSSHLLWVWVWVWVDMGGGGTKLMCRALNEGITLQYRTIYSIPLDKTNVICSLEHVLDYLMSPFTSRPTLEALSFAEVHIAMEGRRQPDAVHFSWSIGLVNFCRYTWGYWSAGFLEVSAYRSVEYRT